MRSKNLEPGDRFTAFVKNNYLPRQEYRGPFDHLIIPEQNALLMRYSNSGLVSRMYCGEQGNGHFSWHSSLELDQAENGLYSPGVLRRYSEKGEYTHLYIRDERRAHVDTTFGSGVLILENDLSRGVVERVVLDSQSIDVERLKGGPLRTVIRGRNFFAAYDGGNFRFELEGVEAIAVPEKMNLREILDKIVDPVYFDQDPFSTDLSHDYPWLFCSPREIAGIRNIPRNKLMGGGE